MKAGIALQFKQIFNGVEVLKAKNKKITEIAFLKQNNQWILYLITKRLYHEKPTYVDIFNTLLNLKKFCLRQLIKVLGLLKICSMLDGKKWSIISNMLKFIFQNTLITIKIYVGETKHANYNVRLITKHDKNKTVDKNLTTPEVIIEHNNNEQLNPALRNKIVGLTSYLEIADQVPKDGNCGAHALRFCLKYEGLNVSTLEILNKINIQTCNSGYQLTDEDLSYLADSYNRNLVLITTSYNKADKSFNIVIIYWKTDRPYIGMFHNDNHWTPGRISKTYK
jgi:hypothetical protein